MLFMGFYALGQYLVVNFDTIRCTPINEQRLTIADSPPTSVIRHPSPTLNTPKSPNTLILNTIHILLNYIFNITLILDSINATINQIDHYICIV